MCGEGLGGVVLYHLADLAGSGSWSNIPLHSIHSARHVSTNCYTYTVMAGHKKKKHMEICIRIKIHM